MTSTSFTARLTGALVAAAGLAWTSAAWAEMPGDVALGAGYSSSDAPLGSPTELRIDLRGTVSARCEVVQPRSLGRINLSRAGEASGAFAIDCNTPFLLRVRSANGAMVAASQSLAGVAASAGYRVGVQVGTDKGREDLGWCDAANLAANASGGCAFAATNTTGGWSSKDATAIRQSGALRLRWDDQADETPRLGAYQDNIIIEVEVRS